MAGTATQAAAGSWWSSSRWAPVLEEAQDVGRFLDGRAAPVLDLLVRVWLAQAFLMAGMLKSMHWSATVSLYLTEHLVPGIAPTTAAMIATGIELVCPLLLIAGLATRLASVLLLIQALAPTTGALSDAQLYQVMLLALLVARGPGAISLDRMIARHLSRSALPFARPAQRLGDALDRLLPGPVRLVVRVVLGIVLLGATGGWWSGGAPGPILAAAGIAVCAALLALGLATRLAALALLAAVFFLSEATMGVDSRPLLILLLLGFVFEGGGPLALDRWIVGALVRRLPSLGDDPAWLADAPRVVIVGAGFGGIAAARALRHARARITLVDRRNYHLFQPLLYQVATASLSPAEIATPIRALVRDQTNCRVVMGRVTAIDREQREVIAGDDRHPYDYLVLATGARHSYFGKDDWERLAPGLKKIDDATAMRGRILAAFERAEATDDPTEQRRLLTFVIVGGGPTGVELAGAIAELARWGMQGEFRHIDPGRARVILVQSAPRLLPAMPESLGAAAERSLREIGVDVLTGARVEQIDGDGVLVGSERYEAATVLWAAGVMASPAGRWIAAERDGSGRVVVGPDLAVPGAADVFALGDTAACPGADGKPLPGLAAVAKQQGQYVARVLRARIEGRPAPGPFRYRDWGSMATIGRKSAVADLRGLRLTGSVAWWLWSAVHVGFLVDARSRIAVLLDWFWSYLTYGRGMRLITGNEGGID